MDDQITNRRPDSDPAARPEPGTDTDRDADDLEGHSATIYRRRRGPHPLRHGAPLPDADDRTRTERHPPRHRAVA